MAILLYYGKKITKNHFFLFWWGFLVGSTWEFAFYLFRGEITVTRANWPLPLITKNLVHTFWDAGLFMVGYLLVVAWTRDWNCCTTFKASELTIMVVWGSATSFIVELLGNGNVWEYVPQSYNPVYLTIDGQGYTILPQLIWLVAPVVFYLGAIKILRTTSKGDNLLVEGHVTAES